jgi:hypothetical protein
MKIIQIIVTIVGKALTKISSTGEDSLVKSYKIEIYTIRGVLMLDKTSLPEILKVADEQRNSTWETQFFHAISMGNLDVFTPEAQTGPDGWPYLLTKADDKSAEPFQRILHWLSDKGIGLVVNPHKEFPDYVFTYGMLWNFKETGLFFREQESKSEGVFEFQVKDVKTAGEPSEAYLPAYARKVLRDFLLQQGILAPKVLAFTLDGTNFELAFSSESLGNPDQSEHQGILEAIAWFLPPHYQIALVSENQLPITFVAL